MKVLVRESAVHSPLTDRTKRQCRVVQEGLYGDLSSAPDAQSELAAFHSFKSLSEAQNRRSRLVGKYVSVQDDGEDLFRRRIGLRYYTPHPEFVKNFYERLMIVLPQGGVKLPKHCELDLAKVCYCCHSTSPLSNR